MRYHISICTLVFVALSALSFAEKDATANSFACPECTTTCQFRDLSCGCLNEAQCTLRGVSNDTCNPTGPSGSCFFGLVRDFCTQTTAGGCAALPLSTFVPFGVCPETGACCANFSSSPFIGCLTATSTSGCDILGGTFLGFGSKCLNCTLCPRT
jgi:hypothetical protein